MRSLLVERSKLEKESSKIATYCMVKTSLKYVTVSYILVWLELGII